MKRLLVVTIPLASFFGCKTTLPQSSNTKHVFGETVHEAKGVLPCRWDSETSINPTIDRYLAAVATTIANANPRTFVGSFQIQDICIYVQEDSKLNATATRNLNTITVNSGLVLAAENDAEIASTLSHELAHLTMQSDHGEDVPPEVLRSPDWPKMRDRFEAESQNARDQMAPLQDEANAAQEQMQQISIELASDLSDATTAEGARLQSIYLQLNAFNASQYIDLQIPRIGTGDSLTPLTKETAPKVAADFTRDRKAFLARLRSGNVQLEQRWEEKFNSYLMSFQKIQAIQQQLIDFQKAFDQFIVNLAGPGAKYSWREQQADEVGYELFLRAGFEPTFMPWLERKNMGEPAYLNCLENNVRKGVAPNRANNAHPTDCWRIYDFLYLEARYHASDYKSFFATSHTVNLPSLSGQLDAAKKSWTP